MLKILICLGLLTGDLAVGEAIDEPTSPPTHAVALIYHHVSSVTPRTTSVTPDLFDRHLEFLSQGGYHVLPLTAIVDSLRCGGSLPDRTITLTFDDGYASVYSEAWPRLRDRGWPFTVFVCPEAVDHRHGPVMNWDQLRELATAGVTVASHGLRHDHLQRYYPGEDKEAWLKRLGTELKMANERLEQELGAAAPLLAYPYGEFDPDLCNLVRDLGWAGFGQQSGAMGPGQDLACLPRFPMVADFAAIATLAEKLDSLPLPVVTADPRDPNLPVPTPADTTGPVLKLVLAAGNYRPEQLAVFVSGQGAGDILAYTAEDRTLSVCSRAPLRRGRSRYNIVAPAVDGQRWYWYSHVWIVGDRHKD